MKIAVVFLVAAISSCYTVDALDLLGKSVISDVVGNCVIGTLKGSRELTFKLGMSICLYELGKDPMNDEEWKKVYKSWKNLVDQIDCGLSNALGIQVLENAGKPAKEIVKAIVEPLRLLLEKSGLAGTVYNKICPAVKLLSDRGCMPQMLAGDVTNLVINMGTRACQNKRKIVVEDIEQLLEELPCLLGDIALDEVLAGFTDNRVISEAAEEVLDHITLTLCPLVDFLLQTPSP